MDTYRDPCISALSIKPTGIHSKGWLCLKYTLGRKPRITSLPAVLRLAKPASKFERREKIEDSIDSLPVG